MQLYVSTTSPFARLVMISAYQTRLDLALHFVMPWDNPSELLAVNPFSQVPTLVTDDGQVITESSVILAYLLPQLFKDSQTTSLISLSLTIINQAVRAFSIQRFQPDNSTPHPFIARSEDFLRHGLKNAPNLQAGSDDWGQIFLGIALAYVQLRLPHIYEQAVSEANKQVLSEFLQRDFMQKTDSSQLEKLPKSISEL